MDMQSTWGTSERVASGLVQEVKIKAVRQVSSSQNWCNFGKLRKFHHDLRHSSSPVHTHTAQKRSVSCQAQVRKLFLPL